MNQHNANNLSDETVGVKAAAVASNLQACQIISGRDVERVTIQIKQAFDEVSESLRAEVARLKEELSDAENKSDDLWLSILAKHWKSFTGELWDDRDGETREEGISSNITRLFDHMDETKQQLTTALATVEELRKEQNRGNHTCSICNWSNTGCYNVGEPNGEPIWMCHGCIKREHDQVSDLTQQLREAQAACVVKDIAIHKMHQFSLIVDKAYADKRIESVTVAWRAFNRVKEEATSDTCGQPILNEIDALKKQLVLMTTDRDCWFAKDKTRHEQLDALKKERDELRLETARIAQDAITAFSDKIRKVETERDTALRSLADANVRLDSYDEMNSELTRMHSEACDQRNEAQRSLATSEAATAVLREALEKLKKCNCRKPRENPGGFMEPHSSICAAVIAGDALSTTPASDLLADKARLRKAWEAGFALCRKYGDNHPHFEGEQKERQWEKFLTEINPI